MSTDVRLDRVLLDDVGLGDLLPREANRVIRQARELLEVAIGGRIWRSGERRLEKVISHFDSEDDHRAYEELNLTCPLVHLIVWEEFIALKTLLRQEAPSIVLIEKGFEDDATVTALAESMTGPSPFVSEHHPA